jgi:3-hydroxyacyl-[acyl-carrier-protein] dehydratase
MRLEYFRLIDRIADLDAGAKKIRAEAAVPLTSTIFEGHFPGRPLMPGVLLVEAMAQTSGWLLIALTGFTRMPFLVGVKDARFRTFVEPGQMLMVSANLEHEGSGFAVTNAEIAHGGKTVCDAEIRFRLMEFPDPVFRVSMEQVAAEIGLPMRAGADG